MSYVINVFIFCSQLRSIKNREEGENGRKSKDEIKEELFKSLIDNEIEFKFGWIVKTRLRYLKKRVLDLTYKKGLLFEKSKDPDKFWETHINGVIKTHKSVGKVSKTRSGNKF